MSDQAPREELSGHRASCACEDCMPIGTDDDGAAALRTLLGWTVPDHVTFAFEVALACRHTEHGDDYPAIWWSAPDRIGRFLQAHAHGSSVEYQPAEPETASERPDAGLSRDWYTLSHIVGGIEDDTASEVFERARKVVAAADRADAAEAKLREEQIASTELYGRVFTALGLSIADPWHGLVEAAANVRAERDEAREKLDEIRDRAVGFHAFLLGPGSRNPDQVRTRAVGALDGIRAVFEDATPRGGMPRRRRGAAMSDQTPRVPDLWWSPDTGTTIERCYDGILRGPGWTYDELPADAVRLVPEAASETEWGCRDRHGQVHSVGVETEAHARAMRSMTPVRREVGPWTVVEP